MRTLRNSTTAKILSGSESVSMDNSINFFKYSKYGKLIEDRPLGFTIVDRTKWEKGEKVENKKNLKGSSFWTVKYFNRK